MVKSGRFNPPKPAKKVHFLSPKPTKEPFRVNFRTESGKLLTSCTPKLKLAPRRTYQVLNPFRSIKKRASGRCTLGTGILKPTVKKIAAQIAADARPKPTPISPRRFKAPTPHTYYPDYESFRAARFAEEKRRREKSLPKATCTREEVVTIFKDIQESERISKIFAAEIKKKLPPTKPKEKIKAPSAEQQKLDEYNAKYPGYFSTTKFENLTTCEKEVLLGAFADVIVPLFWQVNGHHKKSAAKA